MARLIGNQSPLGCLRGDCSVEFQKALPWSRSSGPSSVPSNSRQDDSCPQRRSSLDVRSQDTCGTPPSLISLRADGNKEFQTFLADQLRSLEETLIKRHEQELNKVYETIVQNNALQQDQIHLNLDASNQDNRQPQWAELEGIGQQQQRKRQRNDVFQESPAIEAALELACVPETLAKIEDIEEMGLGFFSSRRSSIAHASRPRSSLTRSHSSSSIRRACSNMSRVELHTVFRDVGQQSGILDNANSSKAITPSLFQRSDDMPCAGDEMTDRFSRYVSHPLSWRRFVYDTLALVLITYDMVVIPLELTSLIGTRPTQDTLITVVWSVDLVQSFFRGYIHHGVMELRLFHTAKDYMTSWFLPDLTLVLLDWILLNLTSTVSFAGVARSGKALRFWRLVRMMRFIRIYRLQKILHVGSWSDMGHTFKIFMWIGSMLMLSHLIACFWYLLGSVPFTNPSWVWAAERRYMQQYGEEPDKWYLYLTSLHWAVTQFTPASMEVTPRNSWERLYNLFIVCISLVLFPTFLSSITNNVAAWRRKNEEYIEAKRNLVAYLQQNRISLQLSTRIQSIVLAHCRNMRSTKRTHEPDVSMLNFLPPSLKEQLHTEVYHPKLISHPFLNLLADRHERTIIKICHTAMCQESLKPGEELFAYGKEAEMVHIVELGSLLYCEGSQPPYRKSDVHAGSWLCDQVLWMTWIHRGQMTAVQPCELANLDANLFCTIVAQRSLVRSLCGHFATHYLAIIQDELFNDLGCPLEELQNIISTEFNGPLRNSNFEE